MSQIFIFLVLFFALHPLKAQSILGVLEETTQILKTLRTIDGVKSQVEDLRRDLSARLLKRDATSAEVKTIIATETASLLVDGAHDFQFGIKDFFDIRAYELPTDE